MNKYEISHYTFAFVMLIMLLVFPILIFFTFNDTKMEINYDNLKVVDKGNVSSKRIERGFGNLYLIEIHNNSEYNLGKQAYYDILINDYIIIYQVFFDLIYLKINSSEV